MYVVQDGVVEEPALLWHDANGATKAHEVYVTRVLAVDRNASLDRVVEAVEQADDGAFTENREQQFLTFLLKGCVKYCV